MPLRLTHSALMFSYAAWSSASSFELSTCSTLRTLRLRGRLWPTFPFPLLPPFPSGCRDRPGSLMLGGLRPAMMLCCVVTNRASDPLTPPSHVTGRMLLHWSTLEPTGPSNLAALRFSSLVRVRSLRIFPKDAVPFSEQPEIVS